MIKPGWAVWITGPPSSGKSTVAKALKTKLNEEGVRVQILETDTLRRVLTPNPSYSPEEIETFYNSMVYIGALLTQNGVNVIFDATASKRRWRRAARGLINDFLQIYIRCPLEVCRERDLKGIHRKTKTREAKYTPSAWEEHEEPWQTDVELDCMKDSTEASRDKIMEVMRENGFI